MMSPLPSWTQRPREEANLFNPAFTSLLIARAIAHHERSASAKPMPFPLAFFILPIVLHPGTRDALPRAADTNMFGWITEHPEIKALFPVRAERLTPVTQEALRFAIAHKKFDIQGGQLISGARRFALSATPDPTTNETNNCLQKAAFLGRWFAASDSVSTIFATWGVRP